MSLWNFAIEKYASFTISFSMLHSQPLQIDELHSELLETFPTLRFFGCALDPGPHANPAVYAYYTLYFQSSKELVATAVIGAMDSFYCSRYGRSVSQWDGEEGASIPFIFEWGRLNGGRRSNASTHASRGCVRHGAASGSPSAAVPAGGHSGSESAEVKRLKLENQAHLNTINLLLLGNEFRESCKTFGRQQYRDLMMLAPDK